MTKALLGEGISTLGKFPENAYAQFLNSFVRVGGGHESRVRRTEALKFSLNKLKRGSRERLQELGFNLGKKEVDIVQVRGQQFRVGLEHGLDWLRPFFWRGVRVDPKFQIFG